MRGHGRARTALAELSDPMFESLRPITLAAAGILALTGMAIATAQSSERPEYNGTAVKSLTAPLKDGTGATIGSVQMWEDANGVVKIFVGASGLTAGDHGIHVHAVGQCTPAAFTSAGGHYNPGAKKHGLESPDGHHAGDLPNLEVNADGTTAWVTTTNDVTLTAGAKSIFDNDGSALIIHAGPDDQVTDPTGNSGARVACALLADPAPGSIPAPTASAPAAPNTGSGLGTEAGGMPDILKVALVGIAAAMAAGSLALRRR